MNLIGEPTLRTDATSAVRVRLLRTGDRLVLHLVNRLAGVCGHAPPALAGCTVYLNTDRLGPISSAMVVPGETPVELRPDDPWLELRIPALDPIDTMIVLSA